MAAKPLARLVLAAFAAAALSAGAAMTVEQAYQAIGHARTPFEWTASLPAAEAQALQRFFTLTDEGVIVKAEGMRAHAARDEPAMRRVLERYDALVAALKAESFPANIAPARDLVAGAVVLHRRYFASHPAGSLRFVRADLGAAAEVTGASRQLIDAYGLFMRAYPTATARQKQAFYDHLCALDFL